MGMAEALRDAMRIAMRTDPTVFLLGEDIGVPGGFGGGFTVTLGLSEEFGRERVIDTPISEGAIVGAAVGAAMAGSGQSPRCSTATSSSAPWTRSSTRPPRCTT